MKANSFLQADGSKEKGNWEVRLDCYKAIFAIVILFTTITRLYGLAYKPYHHDESLYATYSWYLYEGRGFKYNPMMHGPATFYITALAFSLFGDNDFTARLPAALCGIALICCTPLLKRRLCRTGSLAAAVLFAVSPTYMYYSRFLSHDIFVAFWAFLSIAFYMQFHYTHKRGYIYGLGIALAFMFCSKVDSYIYLFIFSTFLIFMKLFERCFCKTSASSVHCQAIEQASDQKGRTKLLDIVIAAAIFFGIFYLFYTSFLTHKPGFIDGLYRKSLGYWFHQNRIQRIKGAFTGFCPIAATYELPLLIVIYSGLIALLRKRLLPNIILIASSVIALPLILLWRQPLSAEPWDVWFHVTNTMHIVFALYVFILCVTAMCIYLRNGQRFPAFLSYWCCTSILIYSYGIGKTPWLLIHILMPIILWASFFIKEFLASERFRSAPIVYGVMMAIGLLLSLQASIRLCFYNAANPVELMVYTQTSMDIKEPLNMISAMAEKLGGDMNLCMAVQGESSWPLTWYLRTYKNWLHWGRFTKTDKFVIIFDWEKGEYNREVLEPYYKIHRLKLRGWWIPKPLNELEKPFVALLKYYFFREPWSTTGSQDIAYCIRKDLIGEP